MRDYYLKELKELRQEIREDLKEIREDVKEVKKDMGNLKISVAKVTSFISVAWIIGVEALKGFLNIKGK